MGRLKVNQQLIDPRVPLKHEEVAKGAQAKTRHKGRNWEAILSSTRTKCPARRCKDSKGAREAAPEAPAASRVGRYRHLLAT